MKSPKSDSPFGKWLRRHTIPSYDETAFFLVAFILIVLAFVNQEFVQDVRAMFARWWSEGSEAVLAAPLIVIGVCLSLFHAMTARPKKRWEKLVMLTFMVLISLMVGIQAVSLAFEKAVGWYLIFPILNAIDIFWLFLLFRFDILNENNIDDRDARAHELVVGAIAVAVLIYIFDQKLGTPWPITFSSTLAYASMMNGIVTEFILKRKI